MQSDWLRSRSVRAYKCSHLITGNIVFVLQMVRNSFLPGAFDNPNQLKKFNSPVQNQTILYTPFSASLQSGSVRKDQLPSKGNEMKFQEYDAHEILSVGILN